MAKDDSFIITVDSDLDVVGYNSENADLDHPKGEIIAERFFLHATNENGDRRRYGCFVTAEEAEAAIPDAPDILSDEWSDTYPKYGSRAYQQYGQADEVDFERRMNDAEEFGLDTRYMRF